MKYVLVLLLFTAMPALTFDFGTSCDTCDNWFVVLDGVMGGLSEGDATMTDTSILFKGKVSLENNGGFASLRTSYGDYDLSSYEKVSVRYRSTGQDFGFTLTKYRQFWRANYKANLPITSGEWQTVTFKLTDFETYRLGRKLSGHLDTADLSKIIRLGFISNTKAPTAFEIEIDRIVFE
jgi:NADH dehydrogenase [ubiquinone] 1 alpha subcomplex assembly factor 1